MAGEERILVPSPKVATYDLQARDGGARRSPTAWWRRSRAGGFDLVVVNYANTDMVGHTGDLAAADGRGGRGGPLPRPARGRRGGNAHGALLITADHGNAERMRGA